MGNLFTRAFKRLTQGSQSRSQQQEQQQQQNNRDQQGNESSQTRRVLAQSIPVGQSIDSSEYAALDTSNARTRITTTTTTTAKIDPSFAQDDAATKSSEAVSGHSDGAVPEEDEKQGVEEAVIKIQALVRGHLARKALKDAQHPGVPPPNALGQSQFDENNLLRDPPSSIFTHLPMTSNEETQRHQQPVTPANSRVQVSIDADSRRTSLDPIAEVPVESLNQATTTTMNTTNAPLEEVSPQANAKEEDRKKLSLICSRSSSSPSQLETPQTDAPRDSLSPVPSEANASIDLTCDTPASVSINLMDSSLIPTDKMASVLHHKQEQCNDRAREMAEEAVATADSDDDVAQIELGTHQDDDTSGTRLTINENGVGGMSESLESEKAAAIRIQSAFRGYRTRKNSPYRTRSPNSSMSKRSVLRQQEATILDENDEPSSITVSGPTNCAEMALGVQEESVEVSDISESVIPFTDERRSSRTRHRDAAIVQQQQHEPNQRVPSADEFTVTEDDAVKSVLAQHPNNNSQHESAKVDEKAAANDQTSRVKEALIGPEKGQRNSSLDAEESEPNTLEDLTSALEIGKTTESVDTNGGSNKVSLSDVNPTPGARPSIGAKSEASVETYDTDSSILGAALSLNEDLSAADQTSRDSDSHISLPTEQHQPTWPALEPIDETKSLDTSLQLDVSESEGPCRSADQSKAYTEDIVAALVGEEEEEAAQINIEPTILDEQEQRTIELESDDIERRDPRGQVSEERAKSPQIRLDAPQFGIIDDTAAQVEESDGKKDEINLKKDGNNLSPSRGDESGHSSPAPNSSAANSSDEEDSDQGERDAHSPSNDQVRKQQQSAKNKKRNNRNKRKGKK